MGKGLFDEDDNDSESEIKFGKSSEYSKKYDTLRRKEELLKLKNKYGTVIEDSGDSSSSEDIEDVTFTEQFEKDFFRTLSCLKNKDPRIYDAKTRFFLDSDEIVQTKTKQKVEKPLTIQDYNRELILKDKIRDDEEESLDVRPSSPTYVEEQNDIKKSFRNAFNDDNESDNEEEKNIGGMFSKRVKTKEEEAEEEKSYRDWLRGQEIHLKNDEETELKPLKDYWTNPKLNEDEAFLRDYVLNQRFKETTNSDYIPSYDEIVNEQEQLSEDEKLLNEQTEFEHKFNFRFEEPDQEFIKRYPRTLENSLRRKDDKRAQKRTEVRERKAEEKKRKQEEITQLKSLKLKEIQEKIMQIKEITGNDQLAFDPEDLEGDFDPDAYDKKMQQLFNEEYYGDNVDEKKPKFPDLDDDLEIENWDSWNNTNEEFDNCEPHCEDEDFNMDCDYDPQTKRKKSLIDNLKDTIEGPKKKRRRKNKLSEALSNEKPVFDPESLKKSFSQYIDEYYKLDCEDIIGDMPCRFKYRQVPACDYGLSVEEILMADDKELNSWYPLKKTLQYRPDHMQFNDQKIFSNKSKDINMKRRILPSLFKSNQNDDQDTQDENQEISKTKKKKRKNKNKNRKENNASDSFEAEKIEVKVAEESFDDQDIQNPELQSKTQKANSKKDRKKNKNKEIANNVNDNDEIGTVRENSESVEMNSTFDNNLDGDRETQNDNQEMTKKKKKKTNKEIAINGTVDDRNKTTKDKLQDKITNTSEDQKTRDKNQGINKKKNKKKRKNKEMSNENMDKTGYKVDNKRKKVEINESSFDNSLKNSRKEGKKHFKNNKLEKNSLNKFDEKSKSKFKHKAHMNSKKDAVSNMTDERLKAYGLNPKKYRSFMKFKKY